MFGFGTKVVAKPVISGFAMWASHNPVWATALGITSTAVLTVGINRALNAMWADKQREAANEAAAAAKDAVAEAKATAKVVEEELSRAQKAQEALVKDLEDHTAKIRTETSAHIKQALKESSDAYGASMKATMTELSASLNGAFERQASSLVETCGGVMKETSALRAAIQQHGADVLKEHLKNAGTPAGNGQAA